MSLPAISVVVPTLNAAATLADALASVAGHECIVADGGSRDATRSIAEAAGAAWIEAPPGRGTQMNAGAAAASGDILLFLHADTVLESGWDAAVRAAVARPGFRIGAFRLKLDAAGWRYRMVEWGTAFRNRFLTGPYGDQALFLRREDFPGYPEQPLMEDVELVRQLGPARLLRTTATTSATRWQRDGCWRRTWRNLLTRVKYRCGATPTELAAYYRMETRRVVMFCKWPEAGRVKTRLAAGIGEERAVVIYRSMVEATLDQVRVGSGEAVICYGPAHRGDAFRGWLGPEHAYQPQEGGDLGARMLHAFQVSGADKTLVIGTDCPDLRTAHLEQAFADLDATDVVLGPSEDGGYWLIGARGAWPELFRDMTWSTDSVFAETVARCESHGLRVARLEILRDVDDAEDLAHFEW